MSFYIIIPARLNSTRLPGKALLNLGNKSMIQRTYERALRCGAAAVYIATDDAQIAACAQQFGASVLLTASTHPTGTDRLAEAARLLGLKGQEIIVNLQGDEPFMPPENIVQVAENLRAHPSASMATLCQAMSAPEALANPHRVKVVCDAQGYALYFSRSWIPHGALRGLWHLGLYAYRAHFLQDYVAWGACELENTEHLEQLRALWWGHRIHVELARAPFWGDINTPEDLVCAQNALKEGSLI